MVDHEEHSLQEERDPNSPIASDTSVASDAPVISEAPFTPGTPDGSDIRGQLSGDDTSLRHRLSLEDDATPQSLEGESQTKPKRRNIPLMVFGGSVMMVFVVVLVVVLNLGHEFNGGASGNEVATASQESAVTTKRQTTSALPKVYVDPDLAKLFPEGPSFLDRETLMLDEMHYRIADLEADSSLTAYRAGAVSWHSEDPNVVKVEKVTLDGQISRCHIVAVRQGMTEVIASLPDGTKATCNIKVISGSTQKRPGDITFHFMNMPDDSVGLFYMQDGDWGDAFVESYVNNIEKIIHDYQDSKEFPEFREEAKEKELWCYEQKGLIIDYDDKNKKIRSMGGPGIRDRIDVWMDDQFIPSCMIKKKGEISANGWLFLVTTKNEWGYLLHKSDTDGWKVIASKAMSTGYNREKFEQYMCIKVHRPEGVDYTYEKWHREQNSYQNCVHKDVGNVQGRPDSAGCIRVGYLADGAHEGDSIMYYLFHDADLGTRVILF